LLDCCAAPFAGANADTFFHWHNKDFAVTDFAILPRPAGFENRRNRRFDEFIVDGNLELYLPEQVDRNLVTPKGFCVSELTAESLDVQDRQPKNLNLRKCLFHPLEFVGLNDCDDEFQTFRLFWFRTPLGFSVL